MTDTRNTAITYIYRDGSNYKVDHTVIFEGTITLERRDRPLKAMLPPEDPDIWGVIIPGQIGLADLQDRFHQKEMSAIEAMLAPQEGPVGLELPDPDRARFTELLDQMRATKPQWRPSDDHIYHAVTDITLTDRPATDERTIDAFIDQVAAVIWDDEWLPVSHADMVANYAEALREGWPDDPDV
jgi:hypothetical protein